MPVGVGNQNFENLSKVMNKLNINGKTIIIAHSIDLVFVCKYLIANKIKVKQAVIDAVDYLYDNPECQVLYIANADSTIYDEKGEILETYNF